MTSARYFWFKLRQQFTFFVPKHQTFVILSHKARLGNDGCHTLFELHCFGRTHHAGASHFIIELEALTVNLVATGEAVATEIAGHAGLWHEGH